MQIRFYEQKPEEANSSRLELSVVGAGFVWVNFYRRIRARSPRAPRPMTIKIEDSGSGTETAVQLPI